MFKGYIDDSSSNGFLVLGGYISHVDKWEAFSAEWSRMLSDLNLDEFKMSRMGQSSEGREKAGWFYRIIEKHALHRVAIITPIQEIKDAVASFRWPENVTNRGFFANPYFLTWKGISMMVNSERMKVGAEQPIDLIFDSQTEEKEILRAWLEFEREATPAQINAVGGMPHFLDSKNTLPLQAADFYAWWCRKWFVNATDDEAAAKAIDSQNFPWEVKNNTPNLTIKLSRDIVLRVLGAMFNESVTGKISKKSNF